MKMKFKSIGQKLQNEQWYLCVIIKTFNAKKKKEKYVMHQNNSLTYITKKEFVVFHTRTLSEQKIY